MTNVRCLSEGVDVPSLDAVLFLSPQKSKIDKIEIIQAVGRVMRKSFGKKYDYIIIPVVVPIDKSPEDDRDASKDFGTVWDVLKTITPNLKNFTIPSANVAKLPKPPNYHH